jgi:hypothetical protein
MTPAKAKPKQRWFVERQHRVTLSTYSLTARPAKVGARATGRRQERIEFSYEETHEPRADCLSPAFKADGPPPGRSMVGPSSFDGEVTAWRPTRTGALNAVQRKICRERKRLVRQAAKATARAVKTICQTFDAECGCP